MKQNKNRKQTPERAQYGLELIHDDWPQGKQ